MHHIKNLCKQYSLQFSDAKLEQKYHENFREETMQINRVAMLVGIALFAVFGILDYLIDPYTYKSLWLIRYVVVCPVLILAYITLNKIAHQNIVQGLLAAAVMFAGLSIIVMTIITRSELGTEAYYAGLLLVIIFAYSFIKLPFLYAFLVSWFMTFAYIIVGIFFINLDAVHLTSNMFFLVSGNIIGMVSAYLYERATRKEFLLHNQLKDLAIHDPLTGVYNRHHLTTNLEKALSDFKRYQQMYTIMMLDLNNFKLINDTHGYLIGDEVLKSFAELLIKTMRKSDTVYRYGGDEFIILMPNISSTQTTPIITRLHEQTRALTIPNINEAINLDFTAGVITTTHTLSDHQDIIKACNEELKANRANKFSDTEF